MHVAQISFYLDPAGRQGERMLADWPSLADTAEAVAGAGHRVSVLHAARSEAVISRGGVDYLFLEEAPKRRRRERFAAALRDLSPDVVHVHGLGYPEDVVALAQAAPRLPIVLQDHAGAMPRFWRRGAWRRGFAVASGVAFTGVAQGERFRERGLLETSTPLFDIPESSSHFQPGDRAAARATTGLSGDPCVLWVGRLNENKDPLTVLDGFALAARALPGAKLWCAFGDAPMLAAMRSKIAADERLAARVRLLGTVEHARVEMLMRAADLFVAGSRAEGSGYALIEALACGLPAVVTDIPAFRSLLADSDAGMLWRAGDSASLAQALIRASGRPQASWRAQVRAHFEREVSFAAIGRKWSAAYQSVLPDAHD